MSDQQQTIVVGDLVIDPLRYTVERAGKRVDLTRTEWDMLFYMAQHPDRPLSREELLDTIWEGKRVIPNTVEVYVKYLRNKLGDGVIKTRRGFGYVLLDKEAA